MFVVVVKNYKKIAFHTAQFIAGASSGHTTFPTPLGIACSTVTVTKCQAALRTLQAFPFFRPTCLCKEPGIDPDCNYFRDFLFDHPCGFVSKKVASELSNVSLRG
uniref:GDNF/GAS1 domain-containing protein n=1 Tax=Anopheles epiroticus TaxID=199890 RepID=A0A182P373_9DIPT